MARSVRIATWFRRTTLRSPALTAIRALVRTTRGLRTGSTGAIATTLTPPRVATTVIRIDEGHASRASEVLAGEMVQEQIPWGTVVGGRKASVSNDLEGKPSHEAFYQAIFGFRRVDLLRRHLSR